MNKNVMKKWVKALRSGKYKQGQGLLKQTTSFTNNKTYHCCLGVLCELYDNEMRKNKKKTLNQTQYCNGAFAFNRQPESLPKTVQKWAGLHSKVGVFRDVDRNDIAYYGNFFISLADMNDLGCSFKKIAKTIEKDWENL